MKYETLICTIIFYLMLCIRFRKKPLILSFSLRISYICSWLYDLNYKHDNFLLFLIFCILSFVSTSFSMQPQPLIIFLQSEAGTNNKQGKNKSCKYQSHKGIFISEIDRYLVSFFLDDKGLKRSLLWTGVTNQQAEMINLT